MWVLGQLVEGPVPAPFQEGSASDVKLDPAVLTAPYHYYFETSYSEDVSVVENIVHRWHSRHYDSEWDVRARRKRGLGYLGFSVGVC